MESTGEGVSPSKICKKSSENSSVVSESENLNQGEIQTALDEVEASQNELDALNDQASQEILLIEQKYNKLRKPYYERRNDSIKRIPSFWLKVFVNHPQVSTVLKAEEKECIQYLSKLEVEEFENIKSGYRLNFYFDDNPYFENTILTKEFHLGSCGKPVSQSTQIKWKEGHDLIKKLKGRVFKRNNPFVMRSFFAWFTNHSDPTADDLAEALKDDIWQNPLQYYIQSGDENGIDSEDASVEDEHEVVVIDDDDDDDGDTDEPSIIEIDCEDGEADKDN